MLIKKTVHITPYDLDRNLHIYLPKNYEQSEKRFPVLYMYDGHNLFRDEDATYGKSWGLADYLDRTDTQLIVVGLECNHEGNMRLVEFCPYSLPGPNRKRIPGTGQVLMQWMVDELKPMIDAEFRTLPDREHTGIGGSSMGGLMAYYSVIRHNDVFSKAACLSSAFPFCHKEVREETMRKKQVLPGTRVFLSWGSKESGRKPGLVLYTCFNLEMSHLLTEAGAVTYPMLVNGGSHSEADWEKLNEVYIPFLFGKENS